MENTNEKSPWLVVLLVVLGAGVGLVFGSGLGGVVAMEMYRGEGSFQQAVAHPDAAVRLPLFVMQAISSLFGLVIVPALVWWRTRQQPVSALFAQRTAWPVLVMVVFAVITFAVVDSVIIQWNKAITLPDFLRNFEVWAQAKERELERLTKVLINFSSATEFLIGLLVIAVLAGVSEEFFFRGLIQSELTRAVRNPHVAIWITAIAFSAIHLQFYGFFPRLLLGALFGYFYLWSGNLWVPILAHMVNNAFSLVLFFVGQKRDLPLDVENEAAPWPVVMIFLVLTVFLIQKVYRTFQLRKP